MGLGCVAQSVCVLSFFALGLASSKLADPLGFSESRLGESASTPNLEEITITAPKELLKDVPAIMCAGWRAGVHKDHPAVKQICLGVPTAENQGQKAPTCHTSCTKACAEEHAQGKKHPICDLPYNATSYDKTPQKHSDGKVRIVGKTAEWGCRRGCDEKRAKTLIINCKTHISLSSTHLWKHEGELQRNHNTCTSCKSGSTLVPYFSKSRAGKCLPANEMAAVYCTRLDRDGGQYNTTLAKNVMCTK